MTETTGSGPRLAAGSARSSVRERLRSLLSAWVNINVEICRAITPRHIADTSAFAQFRAAFLNAVLELEPGTVVDLGAGKHWHHNPAVKRLAGFKLVGVDIELAEMAQNTMLDERIQCDVTKTIDLPPGSADLVTVRSGVEHFADNEAFLRNLHALLRPGGRAVLLFPGRYAPFVLINRMLPRRVARAALHLLVPGSEGVLGFPAYYDRTTARQFSKVAQKAGFSVVRCSCTYYSSMYFRFFAPLFALSLLLDHLRHVLAIKELASFYLFVLEKQGARSSAGS
jgi:SAM-dependent methyltransferase